MIIKGNEKVISYISEYLKAQNMEELCDYEADPSIKSSIILFKDGTEQEIPCPLRLGKLLDLLQDVKPERHIQLGNATLDIIDNTFLKSDGSTTPLTEKEVEILRYLHTQKGQKIPRNDLLRTIWNYAEDVETHTIETHIYRLRQKIETDPSKPEILMTDSEGYFISV